MKAPIFETKFVHHREWWRCTNSFTCKNNKQWHVTLGPVGYEPKALNQVSKQHLRLI